MHSFGERVFDEHDPPEERRDRHGYVEKDRRPTLAPVVAFGKRLEMHKRRVNTDKNAGTPQQLVDIASELTMENHEERPVGVAAHHERHDRRNDFDRPTEGLIEPLNPAESRSRQREPQQSPADDRDYYISSADRVMHIANVGMATGRRRRNDGSGRR
jgi:hypothetical protein